MDQHEYARTSAAFLRFADEEARDRSALYDELARGTASDPLVIAFLLTLPKEKRQPNLLFAATRLLFGTPSGWCQFRHVLRENEDAIRAIMLKRSTQTNEPARCATLLPVLARLPQPLALIEVGASAGLCLMADRYGYDYGKGLVRPSVDQPDPSVFSCVVNATTPVPTAPPRVTWRAGFDLDPVDISDSNQAAWPEALTAEVKASTATPGLGRPPKAATNKSAGREPSAPSLGERVLALAAGKTRQERYAACPSDRPNHVGMAVQRHIRAGRIQDGKLYATPTATEQAHATA